jgi:hypothetical protein
MVGDSVATAELPAAPHRLEHFTRPSMGSWMVYGLGSENQNLPGYITIKPSLPMAAPRTGPADFFRRIPGNGRSAMRIKIEDWPSQSSS